MTRPLRRGERYPGDLRRDLLDAALELVTEQGPEAVTIRAVTGRVGVSHAAPARWYPTKQHLLTAIGAEAFRMLVAAVDAELAVADRNRTTGALRACALGYLRFAQDSPGHFTVMWRHDLLVDDPELLDAGAASYEQFLTCVRDSLARGWARGHEEQAVADLCWTTVHGLAVMRLTGAYRALSREEFEARAVAALDVMRDALEPPAG